MFFSPVFLVLGEVVRHWFRLPIMKIDHVLHSIEKLHKSKIGC